MIHLENFKKLSTNELFEKCLEQKNKSDIFAILREVEKRKRLSNLSLVRKLIDHILSLEIISDEKIPLKREQEPTWPWPTVMPPRKKGGKFEADFKEFSALRFCGYSVGKTHGMPAEERKRFLDYFFTHKLPLFTKQQKDLFEDDYSTPGSEKRLRKMANVIASNCRNFKANNKKIYQFAINDYEEDLSYLRKKYFIKGSFPWPESE